MKVTPLKIPDVKLIEPEVFQDERGFFYESFNQQKFNEVLGKNIIFVQDNHSRSTNSVLRGLHYQREPHEQGKLVRVVHGEIFDVAVDIRKESPTYGLWVSAIISADNKKQLWIPEGFAHGFSVLSDTAEICYKTNKYYNFESELTINLFDKELAINWHVNNPILSEKDKAGLSLKDI